MIPRRPFLPFLVAGCLFAGVVAAQENSDSGAPASDSGAATGGGTAPGGSAPGGGAPGNASPGEGPSSAFGNAPANPNTGTVPNAPNEGTTPFGTQPLPGARPQGQGTGTDLTTPGQPNPAAGTGASAFGDQQGPGSRLQQAPASFTVPGFYGRGPQSFTVGEGRLARPRFRYTGSVSTGYDDNVFQTPTHGVSVPDQKVQVLVTPGAPAQQFQTVVPSGDPAVPDSVQTVRIPATAPKFRTVSIPGFPATKRIPSWVTRTDAKMDVQFADRRTLFTFDLAGGVDYYWDRPGTKQEYTGAVSLVYLRKLTGRSQFTISLDSSYQSQPSFSQPNVPTSPSVGSYLTTTAKADLTYRLTPRISTISSITYNALTYEKQSQGGDDYATITLGTEVRYLVSPRLTLIGEIRYSEDSHANDSTLDTTNYFLLLGGELTLSRRFSTTLRVGEEVQSYNQGGSSSSPYVETSLNYRVTPATIVSMNGRYGYEESGNANSTSLNGRIGLQVTQIFSPRLQGTLGLNVISSSVSTNQQTSNSTSNSTNTPTSSSTRTNGADQVQDTLDATLTVNYTLDRHWSLNLSYSYTGGQGPEDTADYFRQRIFLGAAYQF